MLLSNTYLNYYGLKGVIINPYNLWVYIWREYTQSPRSVLSAVYSELHTDLERVYERVYNILFIKTHHNRKTVPSM